MSLLLNKQTISANSILFKSITQTSNILYITSNIGIGTINPLQSLHLQGNTYINSNVGIGTTIPLQSLHIQGQTYFSSNLGIGTTNPQTILHINGDVLVTGNITSSSTTIQPTLNVVNSAGTVTLYPTVLFDSRNSSFTATLPDASSIGYIITLRLLTRNSLPVTIKMSKGSFILTSTNMSRQLVFTSNGWQNYTSTINSFFPTTQQGTKLIGTGYTGTTIYQGYSIALSADGNTLAVGGYADNNRIGAMWIFTRSGSTWTQQGTKLVGTGYTGASDQGISVSLSADGNTLAVGGQGDNSIIGAVWIFTRSGTTWTQQGDKLVGTGYTGTTIYQGASVALSADGNTLAIGGSYDNTNIGATWVFTRSVTTWIQQGTKLVGTGYTGSSYQGTSVSLSADGNTLAVGGNTDNTNIGATWIFTRSGNTWSQQGSKLVGTGYTGTLIQQGRTIAISANGNTLAISGIYDNINIGATWIFTRSGTTWTQQGTKLVGTGYTGTIIYQGRSVALSSDGNTLAASGNYDNSQIGAMWIFTRLGTTWTQQGNKLVGTGYIGTDVRQGVSVALSSDGNTLAVGGQVDNTNIGATWVFV